MNTQPSGFPKILLLDLLSARVKNTVSPIYVSKLSQICHALTLQLLFSVALETYQTALAPAAP